MGVVEEEEEGCRLKLGGRGCLRGTSGSGNVTMS